jgi:hypothetical protein
MACVTPIFAFHGPIYASYFPAQKSSVGASRRLVWK